MESIPLTTGERGEKYQDPTILLFGLSLPWQGIQVISLRACVWMGNWELEARPGRKQLLSTGKEGGVRSVNGSQGWDDPVQEEVRRDAWGPA